MKIILVGINVSADRKFYSLSLRYLRAFALADDQIRNRVTIVLKDYGLETPESTIIGELTDAKPDFVGFSTFFWNMEKVIAISQEIKNLMPTLCIVVGGPQVSYEPKQILEEYDSLDVVVKGEGEETFAELLRSLLHIGPTAEAVLGLAYRFEGAICETDDRPPLRDLNLVPSPHLPSECTPGMDFATSAGPTFEPMGILETYRGCPFRCAYCCWTSRATRFFSWDRVKREVEYMIGQGVRSIYVIDPDLALNRTVYQKLITLLTEHNSQIRIDAFVNLDCMDGDQVDLYCKGPFHALEIGLQTTNPDALKAIQRPWRKEKFEKNYFELFNHPNRHFTMIVDLIVGLPGDNHDGFKQSLAYALDVLKAERVHIFPLTILRGSALDRRLSEFGFEVEGKHVGRVLRNTSYTKEDMDASLILARAFLVTYWAELFHRHDFVAQLTHVANISRFQLVECVSRWLTECPEYHERFIHFAAKLDPLKADGARLELTPDLVTWAQAEMRDICRAFVSCFAADLMLSQIEHCTSGSE
jgi:radical SAM superfamily enzyme YgiQ (UPF0313 family)